MKSIRVLVAGLLIASAGCSGGLSLPEYAEEVETLVAEMNARLDQLEDDSKGQQDLADVKLHAQERVAARSDFVDALRDLEPPGEASDLHGAALGIMERLTAAEGLLADRVMAMESTDGIDAIWETPEGVAARTADAEAVELCLAAQTQFDDTAARSELEGVPWIPPEMKDVVVVALGCIAQDR